MSTKPMKMLPYDLCKYCLSERNDTYTFGILLRDPLHTSVIAKAYLCILSEFVVKLLW